jgi:hypothetical protein
MRRHPGGVVVNTRRRLDPGYMVLHRACCFHIMVHENPAAFTGSGYIKACSNDPGELEDWVRKQGGRGFTKRCSHCEP